MCMGDFNKRNLTFQALLKACWYLSGSFSFSTMVASLYFPVTSSDLSSSGSLPDPPSRILSLSDMAIYASTHKTLKDAAYMQMLAVTISQHLRKWKPLGNFASICCITTLIELRFHTKRTPSIYFAINSGQRA